MMSVLDQVAYIHTNSCDVCESSCLTLFKVFVGEEMDVEVKQGDLSVALPGVKADEVSFVHVASHIFSPEKSKQCGKTTVGSSLLYIYIHKKE